MAYHAEIRMGAGGSWARDEDRETAIERCVDTAFRDWKSLIAMDGEEVPVNVTNLDTDELEVEYRTFPVSWIDGEDELNELLCQVACIPRLAGEVSAGWIDDAFLVLNAAEDKAKTTIARVEDFGQPLTEVTVRQLRFLQTLIDEAQEAISNSSQPVNPII